MLTWGTIVLIIVAMFIAIGFTSDCTTDIDYNIVYDSASTLCAQKAQSVGCDAEIATLFKISHTRWQQTELLRLKEVTAK